MWSSVFGVKGGFWGGRLDDWEGEGADGRVERKELIIGWGARAL